MSLRRARFAFGGLQAQFGLVPAAVQTGDAGGILQNPAALLGLGVDQLADLALAHEGWRAGARGGILKQDAHVARARFPAVDTVGRACLALDAARDFQRVAGVELGGRRARLVVDEDRHLGHVARRARGGAVEDHVVHGGRAHAFVRGLAHHPAQSFEQVGLAAAVGADHAGQALLDYQLGRLDEGLEAHEPEAVDVHGRPIPSDEPDSPELTRRSGRSRVARGSPPAYPQLSCFAPRDACSRNSAFASPCSRGDSSPV